MEKLSLIIFFMLLSIAFCSAQNNAIKKAKLSMYQEGWIDFNKNEEKDIYENPEANLDDRIKDLISQMNLDEKTCQMATLYGFGRVFDQELPNESWKDLVIKDGIGNIDEHLNGLAYHPKSATAYSWPASKHAEAINEVQRFFVENTRLGIPVDFTNEGIRGLCHHGATSFPAQIGIGSTWNNDLVKSIGKITGREAKALGYTNVYSPILDLARDPRWGRTVECYGEDPFLVSKLGLSMVNGLQSTGIAATAKHFAVYSAPKGGRDGDVRTDPHISEREMIEVYLEPFRKAVKEGNLLGIMSSYNDYNGVPVSGSKYFLTDILRDQWGFKGYVVSDSWAVGGLEGKHYVAENFKESIYQSVMAGLNVRTNFTPPEDFIFPLRELVKEGRVSEDIINSRVYDILKVKFQLGLFDTPYVENPKTADQLIHNEASEKIALKASRESIVLLKNDGLLPLKKGDFSSILVTGPNAKAINHSISRYGPSNIDVVSIHKGLKDLVGKDIRIEYAQGCDFYGENWPESELYPVAIGESQQKFIDDAVEKAKKVDLIVVAIGDNELTVGESRSWTSLDLPGNQLQLLQALKKTGKPIVAVLVNGRPMSINWTNQHIGAIIEAWFPGEFGGIAVAEVLFGLYNPGGKLPITFPKTVGQIPFNFPFKRNSQSGQGNEFIQTRINTALYPFGHGLSYTKFEYSDLEISSSNTTTNFDVIKVSFKVANVGDVKGDEVVQLYIQDLFSSVVSYEKLLRAYKRVPLEPGEVRTVEFILKSKDLALLNRDMEWAVEPGKFNIYIGASSEDIRLQGEITLTD